MLRALLPVLILAAACGDNEPPCHEATVYLGPEVVCQGDPDGVCMRGEGNAPTCMPRCFVVDPNVACDQGERWTTMLVTGADGAPQPVCYCEPVPATHTRSHWPDGARDHR